VHQIISLILIIFIISHKIPVNFQTNNMILSSVTKKCTESKGKMTKL